MKEHDYLRWMSENTETKWCNDSAMIEEINAALACGAVGSTLNPPLAYQALTMTPELFKDEVAKIPDHISGDDKAAELIGVVVRYISKILFGIYERTEGEYGFIRAQVQPRLSDDADAMLNMGKLFASWGKNVKVKIPGTAAGIWVLEKLAAEGIPTNPTVCVTISQMIAAAEAYERGNKRAVIAGIKPAPSTSAFVMGRLQDYLAILNDERRTGLSRHDLESAVLAVAKRCYTIFMARGYNQVLMPAAFRCARQVTELVGGRLEMTIHPKIQDEIIRAEAEGSIKREITINNPVDQKAVDRVSKALPEFVLAYEPDALTLDEFGSYGGTKFTLEGFDITGWQKLLTL